MLINIFQTLIPKNGLRIMLKKLLKTKLCLLKVLKKAKTYKWIFRVIKLQLIIQLLSHISWKITLMKALWRVSQKHLIWVILMIKHKCNICKNIWKSKKKLMKVYRIDNHCKLIRPIILIIFFLTIHLIKVK